MSTNGESWKVGFLIQSDVDLRADVFGGERHDAVGHFPNESKRANKKRNPFRQFHDIFVATHFEFEALLICQLSGMNNFNCECCNMPFCNSIN